MYFYAIFKGRETGIFTKWNECFPLINKYPGAIYKKFSNINEAQFFLENGSILNINNEKKNINKTILKNKNLIEDNVDNKNILYIYTDGSCPNNGNKEAIGGIGVHFSDTKHKHSDISKKIKINVKELKENRETKITNQKMELIAIQEALEYIIDFKDSYEKIILYSDSKYSLDCILEYSILWTKNNWKTSQNKDVKHKEIIMNILELDSNIQNLFFKHINSHTGLKDKHSIGNSIADNLAFKAATS